jgi:CheY-like chemotaxis protein
MKYTILVVEDDDNDAFLLDRALKKNGIVGPVQRVTDGVEAVAYLQGKGPYADRSLYQFPDVLFVDLKMPRMSGLELLGWLRDHPEFRVIPTIIMSSSRQNEDVRRAYHLGANTYFVKPTSFEELANLIKAVHDYWTVGIKPRST